MTLISRSHWRPLALALVLLCSHVTVAMANRVLNAAPSNLEHILADALPGDEVVLAPGRYAHLALRDLKGTLDAPITLRSASPSDPATIARLTIHGSMALTLEDLRLKHDHGPDIQPNARPFRVESSTAITFTRLTVKGDRADLPDGPDLPVGIGLAVLDTVGLHIHDSAFEHLARAIVVARSEDVLIEDSLFTGLREMGVRFSQVTGLTVARNTFRDFIQPLDQTDTGTMIAGSTRDTSRPSTDIVIEDNLLMAGTGRWTQSIHLRNEQVDENRMGPEIFYAGVVIRDNLIINAHTNGIHVGPARSVTIGRNTVVRDASAIHGIEPRSWHIPRIIVADIARDVLVLGNVAHSLPEIRWQSDWIVAGNVEVQQQFPTEANHYDAVFYAATPTRIARPADFVARPGGPLDGRDVGAPRLIGLAPETAPVPRRAAASLLEVMRFDPGTGGLVAYGGAGARDRVERILGGEIEIGRGMAPIQLSSQLTAPFFGAEEFVISMRIRPALGHASKGEVLRIHQNLHMRITDRGVVEVDFYPQDAPRVRLFSKPTQIYRDEILELELRYAAATGELRLMSGGEVIGQTKANGRTKARQHWGLSFGNPFGNRKSFDGTIEAFSLSVRQPMLDGVRAGLRP